MELGRVGVGAGVMKSWGMIGNWVEVSLGWEDFGRVSGWGELRLDIELELGSAGVEAGIWVVVGIRVVNVWGWN